MQVDMEPHEPKGNHPLTLGWDDESEGLCAVLVGNTACSLILSSLDHPFDQGFDSRLPPYVDSHPMTDTRS
jgi:hypothetical protein